MAWCLTQGITFLAGTFLAFCNLFVLHIKLNEISAKTKLITFMTSLGMCCFISSIVCLIALTVLNNPTCGKLHTLAYVYTHTVFSAIVVGSILLCCLKGYQKY